MLISVLLAGQAEWPTQVKTVGRQLVIESSAEVSKRDVVLASDGDSDHAAIVIRGQHITVDFGGSTLRGTDSNTEPDQRKGTGILIEGEDVTLKNVNVRGYKVGVMAKSCRGLKLLACDLSYNWNDHLKSTPEREDESDWMSYHSNEQDEWLRYGAAAYLKDCTGFEAKEVKAEGGQCGLMMTGCSHGLVWNCDFSYLSGIGIGMYRSSGNRIMHNKVDYCVRGYSEGVYNRGQDSAGILVYEQSSHNIFAFNSVTHSGDGFFLWAGQSTMDSGRGGCNDNLIYGNDFSHAPTNGIEATFSRNRFSNNKVLECWHGVWGGYSYETVIDHNTFGLNASGIAIEHGQDDKIEANRFYRDLVGIELWQDPITDKSWGYPKHRDCASRDTLVKDNVFSNISGPLFRLSTLRLSLEDNQVFRAGRVFDSKFTGDSLAAKGNQFELDAPETLSPMTEQSLSGNRFSFSPQNKPLIPLMQYGGLAVKGIDMNQTNYRERFNVKWDPYAVVPGIDVRPLKGGQDPFIPTDKARGRRTILVDEWGPYDGKAPRVSYQGKNSKGEDVFLVLGPPGRWEMEKGSGMAYANANAGTVPGDFAVKWADENSSAVWERILLRYIGGAVTDYKGNGLPAGRPSTFGWQRFTLPFSWEVKFFNFDRATEDPVEHPTGFEHVFVRKPDYIDHPAELAYDGGGSVGHGVHREYYAVQADSTMTLEAGTYDLETTSDDGVRLIVDGKKVIDNWTHHAPAADRCRLNLSKGRHTFHIEYFQQDGYATLHFSMKPVEG